MGLTRRREPKEEYAAEWRPKFLNNGPMGLELVAYVTRKTLTTDMTTFFDDS